MSRCPTGFRLGLPSLFPVHRPPTSKRYLVRLPSLLTRGDVSPTLARIAEISSYQQVQLRFKRLGHESAQMPR